MRLWHPWIRNWDAPALLQGESEGIEESRKRDGIDGAEREELVDVARKGISRFVVRQGRLRCEVAFVAKYLCNGPAEFGSIVERQAGAEPGSAKLGSELAVTRNRAKRCGRPKTREGRCNFGQAAA